MPTHPPDRPGRAPPPRADAPAAPPWRARSDEELRFLNSVQVVIFAIFAALYLGLGDGRAAAALAGLLAVAGLTRGLIGRPQRSLAAQLSALLVVAGVHVVIWLDGGPLSAAALWMALVPFALSSCGGPRTYLSWTALSLLVGAGAVAGQQWGLLVPPEVPAHASRLVTLVEITAGIVVLTLVHGRSVFRVRAAERRLARANASLEAEVRARVAAEQQAREAARVAESASAARALFLATVSHEVRTPLSLILAQAQSLRDTPCAPHQDEVLGSIEAAGDLAVRLLNDALDLTRAEVGGLQLALAPVAVAALVREVAANLQRAPEAAALRVRAEIAPEAEGWALADGGRLRQMLYNLGVNAVKFTEKGSVVLRLQRHGGALRVELSDTGPGVPASVAQGLFQPFHQADGTTHLRHGGAGLGLAIVRGLAEAMGGEVGLQSTLGVGSTFWFTIPAPPVEAPPEAPPAARAAWSSAPVLLVEDNPALATLGAAMLRRIGAEVQIAHDGGMAIRLARDARFGLVLLDLGLPDLRARAVVEALRALGQSAPIVALTGMDRAEAEAELGPDSLAAIVQKPFRPSELAEIFAAHFRPQAGAPS